MTTGCLFCDEEGGRRLWRDERCRVVLTDEPFAGFCRVIWNAHAIDKKVVGPSYKEVAAKYRGNAGAAAMLFEKVKKGGQGVWGPVPMPPNATVPDADIKALVAYILALK